MEKKMFYSVVMFLFVVSFVPVEGLYAQETTPEAVVAEAEVEAATEVVEDAAEVADDSALEMDEGFSLPENIVSEMSLAGQIAGVDVEASTVTVQGASEEGKVADQVRLDVDEATEIEKNNEPAGLSDLVVGDNVSVLYTTDGEGENIADSILVEAVAE